jgi:hypothetical protein
MSSIVKINHEGNTHTIKTAYGKDYYGPDGITITRDDDQVTLLAIHDSGFLTARAEMSLEDFLTGLGLKKEITSKREMLDLLEQRLLIGPSDYDRMVVELETGVSDWD